MNERPAPTAENGAVEEILHRLNSGDGGAAWAAFVDRYAALILHTVRQFEFEQERADDCFLHVCEKLCEDGFRRLLRFNTTGPARFRTWLSAVVFNLCIDWHRREFGRAVLLPAISALPTFDQAVYRLYFERAMDRETCWQMLRQEFPDLTREQLGEAIARVHQALSPRQRWRIAMRNRRPAEAALQVDAERLADPLGGPEECANQDERQQAVRRALATLSPHHRLLLLLRYEQGLTLKKIAELADLGDPFRARREIQAALDALAQSFPASEFAGI